MEPNCNLLTLICSFAQNCKIKNVSGLGKGTATPSKTYKPGIGSLVTYIFYLEYRSTLAISTHVHWVIN